MCTCGYVNLLYYKDRTLLHVSATSCGHLQGRNIYLSFKEHLAEDVHNKLHMRTEKYGSFFVTINRFFP